MSFIHLLKIIFIMITTIGQVVTYGSCISNILNIRLFVRVMIFMHAQLLPISGNPLTTLMSSICSEPYKQSENLLNDEISGHRNQDN